MRKKTSASTVPIEDAARAFALASDHNRAIKVHLGF